MRRASRQPGCRRRRSAIDNHLESAYRDNYGRSYAHGCWQRNRVALSIGACRSPSEHIQAVDFVELEVILLSHGQFEFGILELISRCHPAGFKLHSMEE